MPSLPSSLTPERLRLALLGLAGVLALGSVTLLVLATVKVGPAWADQVGAVGVFTTYAAALAVRTGGRPWIFGGFAAALGVAAVVLDEPQLRAGVAVLTATATAVLAVMLTVPARRVRHAARELLVAVAIAAVGAFAAVGIRPVVALERFDYLTLFFAGVLCFGLVFRLGAGWHGIGRRGLVVVLAGTVVLALSITYLELLRDYGSATIIETVFEWLRWVHDTFGAIPRPLQVVVGFPAIMWGTHMRARRRQGWWVCAFGVAGTAQVAGGLMNPVAPLWESGLVLAYSLFLGALVGYLVIRIDAALTGPRGARARREEELTAVRPEPARFAPLL